MELLNNLIVLKSRKAMASSLDVAESFGKQHTHVLDAIRTIVKDSGKKKAEPNFRLSSYKDSTGRKLPVYLLSRTGFSLLAMGFTGKKALAWKLKYIEQFDKMEEFIRDTFENPDWKAYRLESIYQRKQLTDAIKEFVELAKDQGSTAANFYFTNFTKLTQKSLFYIDSLNKLKQLENVDKHINIRELLSITQTAALITVEGVLRRELQSLVDEKENYKLSYQIIKNKILTLCEMIGQSIPAGLDETDIKKIAHKNERAKLEQLALF